MSRGDSWNFEVFGGSFWFMGWLFTIGFAGLSFWQGVLALVAWPYFLGTTLR